MQTGSPLPFDWRNQVGAHKQREREGKRDSIDVKRDAAPGRGIGLGHGVSPTG